MVHFLILVNDNVQHLTTLTLTLCREGFDVVSCQFALHYFFSDIDAANSFLRNVSETCKIGGYFVGTCYSGERVFEKLEETRQNDSVLIIDNEKIAVEQSTEAATPKLETITSKKKINLDYFG